MNRIATVCYPTARWIALGIIALLLPHAAWGEELTSTRGRALQGPYASPNDNGSIQINPAGVALNPRYDISLTGMAPAHSRQREFNLAIVDSLTAGNIGGGVSWNRITGDGVPRDDFAFSMAQRYRPGVTGW